jgi:23S rRNA pseudouridine2605 synthase
MIRTGRVAVNGRRASIGMSVDPQDDLVAVDGQNLEQQRDRPVVLMLHKPRGYVTTMNDPHAARTVAELVAGYPTRTFPVGRLDKESEGLLLMTNDGAAVRRLTHPSSGVEKEYRVTVQPGTELTVTITEGKKHQVRNMCKEKGLQVTRLVRVREGALHLGELKTGAWRHLTPEEVAYVQSV